MNKLRTRRARAMAIAPPTTMPPSLRSLRHFDRIANLAGGTHRAGDDECPMAGHSAVNPMQQPTRAAAIIAFPIRPAVNFIFASVV
jgi:hypothetical protein